MISLRQHAISLAAVFLALAVGVVLGSGVLSDTLLSGLRDQKKDLQGQIAQLTDEKNVLNEKLAAADDFNTQVSGRIVHDALAGKSVVLIRTPDANDDDLGAVSEDQDEVFAINLEFEVVEFDDRVVNATTDAGREQVGRGQPLVEPHERVTDEQRRRPGRRAQPDDRRGHRQWREPDGLRLEGVVVPRGDHSLYVRAYELLPHRRGFGREPRIRHPRKVHFPVSCAVPVNTPCYALFTSTLRHAYQTFEVS